MGAGSQTAAVEIMLGYDFLDLVKVHGALMDAIEECIDCGEAGENTGGYVSEVEHWYESFRGVLDRVSGRLERWSGLTEGCVMGVIHE